MRKKFKSSAGAPRLAKGQLWKLNHAYIQIVELGKTPGKTLLHYRMLADLHERGVRPQLSGIDTMWRYLTSRNAQLVKTRLMRTSEMPSSA